MSLKRKKSSIHSILSNFFVYHIACIFLATSILKEGCTTFSHHFQYRMATSDYFIYQLINYFFNHSFCKGFLFEKATIQSWQTVPRTQCYRIYNDINIKNPSKQAENNKSLSFFCLTNMKQ